MRKNILKSLIKKGVILSFSALYLAQLGVVANAEPVGSSTTKVKKSQITNSQTYDIRQVPTQSVKRNSSQGIKPKVNQKYVPNEVLVKFKNVDSNELLKSNEKMTSELNLVLKKFNTSVSNSKKLTDSNIYKITLKNNIKIEDAITELKNKLPNSIEYVEPNGIITIDDVDPQWVPSEPNYNLLWGLENKGQSINGYPGTPGIDINAEPAWDKTKGSSSVTVAVIDTGLDLTHPDFTGNIFVNSKEIANNGIDDDKNGYVDDTNGWNAVSNGGQMYDDYGHGTHCAGTIAANANSQGVLGVAPNVKIMPIKFLDDSGSGTWEDAIEAVQYAKTMGVKIMSCSWGGSGYSQSLYDIMKSTPGLFVAAAGNWGEDTDVYPHYPSSYDLPNILSVAAIDNTGAMAYFSNYGVKSVDVAAAGVDVYSTIPGNNYAYNSGTSMATPHVAGAAALVLSIKSSLSSQEIKDSITKTVTKLSSLTGKIGTGGMVNAAAAINSIPTTDNDIPGFPLTSTKKTGTLNNITDYDDVFNLKLAKGDVITLNLTGDTGTDFDLYLYDKTAKTVKSNVGILAYSEKPSTSTEKIQYYIKADGTYYIDLYSYAGNGAYTLTYSITKAAPAGTYQDTNIFLGKYGSWSTIKHTSAYSGSYATTNTSGSSISFKFKGTAVDIYSTKDIKQGVAKVTVDSSVSYVDLYNATTSYKQKVFTKSGLTSGEHTVKIEWTGTLSRNAKKGTGATWINVDQIVVK